MPPAGYFIDANLFVLLVVGSVGRDLIAKHRRLREYTIDDYETLLDLLDPVDQVFVTPNTLTETSNLLAQHGEPERSLFFRMLRFIIQQSEEVALLEIVTAETPVVTVDLDLYLEAVRRRQDAAVNFTHLRNLD